MSTKPDIQNQEQHNTNPTPSKRKPSNASTQPVLHFTARNPPWTYLKLQLITNPTDQPPKNDHDSNNPLDPLTARTYLTSALSQFLGLTGTSISIDILKISSENTNTVWIRVPRPDGAAVVAALSSWIGGGGSSGSGSVAWRVCGKGNFLGALVGGDGGDLFVP